MPVLCWLPSSDPLEVRHPRLCFVMLRASEVEVCFQGLLPRPGNDGAQWPFIIRICFSLWTFQSVPLHALGTSGSVSGPRLPVLDSPLGCAGVSCSSPRLSQLLQSQLLVPFLHLWMGEPVHTTWMCGGTNECLCKVLSYRMKYNIVYWYPNVVWRLLSLGGEGHWFSKPVFPHLWNQVLSCLTWYLVFLYL